MSEDQINEIFQEIDIDESGCADVDELAGLTAILGIEGVSHAAIQRAFSAMDVNQNGRVDANEFRQWLSSLSF